MWSRRCASAATVPPGLNYDLWLGPAPKKPLTRKQLHYDWHWMYDYGNGDLGNQGVHEMDIARWFLGQSTVSPRAISIGGRLGYDDAGLAQSKGRSGLRIEGRGE